MKELFYLFFVFFAALIASFFSIRFINRFSSFIAWREFIRRPRGVGSFLTMRAWFNLALLTSLAVGFSLSWFWTGNLSFGVLFLLFIPLIFRTVVRFQDTRRIRALEISAPSFFNALLGLIQSGRGLPSALFELAQSQSTPFSARLKKHLKNYEEGRGLSRILAEFRKKTGLPVVGTYLASLEMVYRQGLEVAPLLEKMIPAIEMEQHFRSKIEDLRRQMSFQATLAFLTPWILSLVMSLFNPEVFESLPQKPWIQVVGGAAFTIEILGVWVLWQITKFY